MYIDRAKCLAGVLFATMVCAGNASADAIGARIDSRLSTNRLGHQSTTERLVLKAKDERETDEALQVSKKKTEAEQPRTRAARTAADTARIKKTRSVIASQ